MPSSASQIGMGVYLASSSAIRLWCFGSRCGMSTKAMPLLSGMAPRNFLNALRPPAEAPMPTTANSFLLFLALRVSFSAKAPAAPLTGFMSFGPALDHPLGRFRLLLSFFVGMLENPSLDTILMGRQHDTGEPRCHP